MPDPISLFRQILESRLSVSVQSDERLILQVQRSINLRTQKLANKGKTIAFKSPKIVPQFSGKQGWQIRPIDLLRKLGQMTTPPILPLEKMPRLSASWATLRYFWAIDPGTASRIRPFRLSSEARELDFHQKTLLSDEFGVGMAGLLMEQQFGAPRCLDMSYAVQNPHAFQNISLIGRTSPDYLMWGAGTTYYVVESKGCQTTKTVAVDQIRRGLEQVVSVDFGPGPYNSETFVISTFLDSKSTKVFVVDPPHDDYPNEQYYERRRILRVKDREAFVRRVSLGNQARLLAWAGLYETAATVAHELEIPVLPFGAVERPRKERETDFGIYEGTVSPLFPELGRSEFTIFTGVRPELLLPPTASSGPQIPTDAQQMNPIDPFHNAPPNMSFGADGTCMIVEGI